VNAAGPEIPRDRWDGALRAWALVTGLGWLVGPFLAAGTLRWPAIWLYMGTTASGTIVQRIYVARRNPAVHARRKHVRAGTKGWDAFWTVVAGPLMWLPPVVAGLGVRDSWPTMPAAFAVLGVVMNTVGGVLFAGAMAHNPHFESTVRIQHDVGHAVFEGGLYRVVRHPGYAGFIIGSLGAPLMLQSWPAMAVAPLLAAWFVVRTALEDATLRRELAGYADYALRVRFRLVPGVW
jgi:protein-S-isoprenylcysteine O-methyltransferase Ste14